MHREGTETLIGQIGLNKFVAFALVVTGTLIGVTDAGRLFLFAQYCCHTTEVFLG